MIKIARRFRKYYLYLRKSVVLCIYSYLKVWLFTLFMTWVFCGCSKWMRFEKKIYVFIRKYANVFDERLREVKKGKPSLRDQSFRSIALRSNLRWKELRISIAIGRNNEVHVLSFDLLFTLRNSICFLACSKVTGNWLDRFSIPNLDLSWKDITDLLFCCMVTHTNLQNNSQRQEGVKTVMRFSYTRRRGTYSFYLSIVRS